MERPLLSYDTIGNVYDSTRFVPERVIREFARCLITRLPHGTESRVLDLGVGTGRGAIPLMREGIRVLGIDLSSKMLEVLRKNLKAGEELPLVRGDIQALPFRSETCDSALAYHVLHLVPDPKSVVEGLRQFLCPGGSLYWLADAGWEFSVVDELRQKYRELVKGKHNTDMPSARDFACVHRSLSEWDQVRVLSLENGSWEFTIHLDALLELFQGKLFSFLLQVPDPVHRQAMNELRPWVRARFPEGYEETITCFLDIREIHLHVS